jgi:hypothetical protein
MQIIVEIHEGEDGRPAGTVQSGDSSPAIPFSGNLEFLALIERLYRVADNAQSKTASQREGEEQ